MDPGFYEIHLGTCVRGVLLLSILQLPSTISGRSETFFCVTPWHDKGDEKFETLIAEQNSAWMLKIGAQCGDVTQVTGC